MELNGEGLKEEVFGLMRRRGFCYPSFEIYERLGGFVDYGELGVLMKRNIAKIFRKLYKKENFFEVETSCITLSEVFNSSGHLEKFFDLVVNCEKCKIFFKLEEVIKIEDEENCLKLEQCLKLEEINKLFIKKEIKCMKCGTMFKEIKEFGTMFKLNIGKENVGFLRPETAQGIFINYLNLFRYAKEKIPFGVFQIGKGFRNEISPRQGLIRLREFDMMEAEYFIKKEEKTKFNIDCFENKVFKIFSSIEGGIKEITLSEACSKKIIKSSVIAYYMGLSQKFLNVLGIGDENIRFKEVLPGERAHYAIECWDLEVLLSYGWIEVAGIADRGDWDLSRHSGGSNINFSLKNLEGGESFLNVIESSFGLDRIFYALLENGYNVKENYICLKLNEKVSPYKVGIFPLVNKEELNVVAKQLYDEFVKKEIEIIYETKGSIGKRYAKMDEIGTKWCVTVDFETVGGGNEGSTVTVRERDTKQQVRVEVSKVIKYIEEKLIWEINDF